MRKCLPYRQMRKVISRQRGRRETPEGRTFRKTQEMNDKFEPFEIAPFLNNPSFPVSFSVFNFSKVFTRKRTISHQGRKTRAEFIDAVAILL